MGTTVYPSRRNARTARFPNFLRLLDAPTTATTFAIVFSIGRLMRAASTRAARPSGAGCLSLRRVLRDELEEPAAAFAQIVHRRGVGHADEPRRVERFARRDRD